MRFVETRVFTAVIGKYLSHDRYRLLQLALALRPDAGKLIPGGGGLRKLRWGTSARGKRGGIRVIYYAVLSEGVCYLLYVYAKNRRENLTARQLRQLRQLIAKELE